MFNLKKLTPVLLVEAIEPVLPFWKQLGFEVTAEVPHGDRLGFVILVKSGVELMYQTRDAMKDDLPTFAETNSQGLYFLEVDDLEDVIARLGATPLAVARRKTF